MLALNSLSMTTTNILSRSLALAGVAALLPFAAFAQTANVSATTDVKLGTHRAELMASTSMSMDTNLKAKSDTAITKRIASLQDLSTKVSAAKHISVSEKSSIQATISGEVSSLQGLQARIDADTVGADLKTDAESITKDFRIYMLVIPQGRIVAASDRVDTIVGLMQQFAPKLQARITAAQTAGKNVTVAQNAYADMIAKVADAQTQANAAVSSTASLQPDQGNASVEASNKTSLKAAEAKLKTAEQDLKAARADVSVILKTVAGTSPSANASTNASATVTQ
jgi:hypothetical protein